MSERFWLADFLVRGDVDRLGLEVSDAWGRDDSDVWVFDGARRESGRPGKGRRLW